MLKLILLLLPWGQAFGLAIDEKLPLRILKTSETKKTVLINRGLEDGLVLGDHAKFFITKGVVARGVIVKASPTRSVWSIYRVVNSKEIEPNRVMNLKISAPLKISPDPTKMISQEDIPEYNRKLVEYYEGSTVPYYKDRPAPVYKGEPKETIDLSDPGDIPLAEGANDLEEKRVEREELQAIAPEASLESETPMPKRMSSKTWEVWTGLHINSLSADVDAPSNSVNDFSGSLSGIDFSLGLSKYFHGPGWYQNISPFVFIHRGGQSGTSLTGIEVDNSVLEYGGGADYHFSSPLIRSKIIPFVGGAVATGSVKSSLLDNSNSNSITAFEYSGTSTSFSVGGGAKYLTQMGLSFFAKIDYYNRNETYSIAGGGEFLNTISGFRTLTGLSYRF